MRGPIDFIVVEFEGNRFKGDVLRELNSAIENKAIAVLDLAIILKDEDSEVSSMELAASDDEIIRSLEDLRSGEGGLISPEDIVEVGELLDDNCSAGLLIVEQLWAKGRKKALLEANGMLLAEGRIHPEAYAEIKD